MLKQISKSNTILSPFDAVKSWNLSNIDNEDIPLTDDTSEIALEYNDYTSGTGVLNRQCNIALEQQVDDKAVYEEGISGSGFFNPDTDSRNNDGTYKRLVYNQIEKAFYNNYRNPLEIFGMDNIDFPLSNTDRIISSNFLMFNIPRRIMGDKIVPGSVEFFDTNLDDNVTIYDDTYGNLIAGENLFSKIQEVRSLGNVIVQGTVVNECS